MSASIRSFVVAVVSFLSVGCAHYANMNTVEESCWSGGQTLVSSQALPDGRTHVVVERVRPSDDGCEDRWEENLVYDRHGRLEGRTLDRLRCGVVANRWEANLDEVAGRWDIERSMDFDRDGADDRSARYAVAADQIAAAELGHAGSCPVMANIPAETPPAMALASLGR